MKVTVNELRKIAIGLSDLNKTTLPIKLAFDVNDIIRVVNPQLEFVDKEERKLFEKYGETADDGRLEVPPENMDNFKVEFTELFTHELDLDIKKIKRSELLEVKDLHIQPGTLQVIEMILE